MTALRINGDAHTVDADPDMPLLWVIRDIVGLKGTKYGCGVGECGACTVHMNGEAKRSCRITLAEAAGRDITTIEGLGDNHITQRAFASVNAAHCGYCIPGQIMLAAAFMKQKPGAEDDDIIKAMSVNLCRCGAYPRILQAVKLLVVGGRK
jgi:isoquinoline 1-oxidoreductase alpha subunit